MLGRFGFIIALAVWAYREGGAGLVGLAGFLRMAPGAIAAPFAATLADRYPRRTLMIISDLARCACMVVLFAVDVTGNLELWSLIALAVLYGAGDGFFYPAYGGIVPLVVDEHVRTNMRQLLEDIRNGSFARELIAEEEAGRPRMTALRRMATRHPVEAVGSELR